MLLPIQCHASFVMRTRRVVCYYVCFSFALWTAFKIAYLWERYMHWQEDVILDAYKRDEFIEESDHDKDFSERVFTERLCQQKESRVSFVKTHKTASSTVTGMLNRFSDLHNLEIALPVDAYRFQWPYTFRMKYVDRTRLKTRKASIICNHLVFNRKELSKIMHRPYKLITIVRNPVEQFVSYFYYEKFQNIYNLNSSSDPIRRFFVESHFYVNFGKIPLHKDLLLRNGMSFDLNFGDFQKRPFNNSIEDFIDYIERSFHLVMITEYFDESLILLKRLLCWRFIDIVYHKKLINKERPRNVSKETVSQIKTWNALDMKLYSYFRKKLFQEILKINRSLFLRDLQYFRRLNYYINSFCKNRSRSNYYVLKDFIAQYDELSVEHELYTRPYCFCVKLLRDEMSYVDYFRQKYPKFHFNSKFGYERKHSYLC